MINRAAIFMGRKKIKYLQDTEVWVRERHRPDSHGSNDQLKDDKTNWDTAFKSSLEVPEGDSGASLSRKWSSFPSWTGTTSYFVVWPVKHMLPGELHREVKRKVISEDQWNLIFWSDLLWKYSVRGLRKVSDSTDYSNIVFWLYVK